MSSPTHRIRCLALALLLCALAAPAAGTGLAVDSHACCAGMSEPCPPDEAPCTSFAASPCCAAAPVAGWPTAAQRESAQATPAQVVANALLAPTPARVHPALAEEPGARTSLVRRSVVLRL